MLNTIAPDYVEELSQVVAPWQLTLRQLSRGELSAGVGCRPVNDILVTNERWQAHVQGIGGTAADYFTVVGNSAGFPVFWQGQAVVENTLACAPGNTECEFNTPHGANHWVMLIPQQKLADYLGVDTPGIPYPKSYMLRGDPRRFRRIRTLAKRILGMPPFTAPSVDALASEDELEATILACVADLLDDDAGDSCATMVSGRYAAYRTAIRYAREAHYALSSPDLAAAAGVSVRVLQLAFRENLGISPHRYLRLCRLGELHRTLLAAGSAELGVTRLMEQAGLSEHGRVAGEYRQLFGELPSVTLALRSENTTPSFLDVLECRAQFT